MWSLVKIVLLLLVILVLGNRTWVKRNNVVASSLWGALTVILIAVLVFEIIEFKDYKEENNGVIIEQKKYQILDASGNVIVDGATIWDYIFGPFHENAFDARTEISREKFVENNVVVGVSASILIVYWVSLLLLFEREENCGVEVKDDLMLLEKYNPMIAACISQNRNVVGRDVIAIILNLVEKQKILLRIESAQGGKYNYMLSPGLNPNDRLDTIEKFIYDWVFEEVEESVKTGYLKDYMSRNNEGVLEINLEKRLKSFPEQKDTLAKLEEIKHMAKDWLKRLKANQKSVPFLLKLFNNILVFLSIIVIGDHIIDNGLQIVISHLGVLTILLIVVIIIMILPIIYTISLIILKTILVMFKSLSDVNEKYTGRKLIAKSVSIIIATLLMMLIVYVSPLDSYLILDILLLGVVLLIVKTDDLMLKHHPELLVDYLNLKRIENKLIEYSMMEDRNIEHIELWNKYYVFSVALGIPLPVKKQSNIEYVDLEENLIINTYDLEGIFYVCKSYLEVMWEMDFTESEKNMKIIKEIFKY